MMAIFTEFGRLSDHSPADEKVQGQVKKMQSYFTGNFYTCTPKILHQLGKMYAGGGIFTENIDAVGGEGTALFIAKAIEIYCEGKAHS